MYYLASLPRNAQGTLRRCRERVSFRQILSAAGRASGPCRNFRPHDAPNISPTTGRSGQAACRTPARHPLGDGPVSPGRHKSAQRGPAPHTRANSLDQLRTGSRPPQLHRPPAGQPPGSNQAIQGRCDQPSKEGFHAERGRHRVSP